MLFLITIPNVTKQCSHFEEYFSIPYTVKHAHSSPQIAMLSHFSHVRLCVTPEMAAHQAPPSLGFSRQEHWSGLPFPSPTHESEKWKVKVKSLSRVRPSATPWTAAFQASPSMGFSRQEYWSGVPLPSPRLHFRYLPKWNENCDYTKVYRCRFVTALFSITQDCKLPKWTNHAVRRQ